MFIYNVNYIYIIYIYIIFTLTARHVKFILFYKYVINSPVAQEKMPLEKYQNIIG